MKSTFIETLESEKPHQDHREKLKPYERFIGNWEFDWVGHKEDGSTWTVPGEWHFSWVLEGRAIQDNWICPRTDLRGSGEYPDDGYGTSIRFYDGKEDCIKVVFVGPIQSSLCVLKASFTEDRITQNQILTGEGEEIARWIFSDISQHSFKWEAYTSKDNGESWKLDQEVFARETEVRRR